MDKAFNTLANALKHKGTKIPEESTNIKRADEGSKHTHSYW